MRRCGVIALALLAGACTRTKEQPKPAAAEPPHYFQVDTASAGAIAGSVLFRGKKPAPRQISMDAEEGCAAMHKTPVLDETVVTGKQGGLANVFVYIKSGLEGKTFRPAEGSVMLDQRGCQFHPRVLGLRLGQTLDVKNSDPVSHNVHPKPHNNRDWNQQQSPQAPDLQRRFMRAEVMIPVRCDVHRWMKSYIGVLDHPYFAVTDAAGKFDLRQVPPGQYTVAAWHESLGEQTAQVTLPPSGQEKLELIFK